MAISVGANVRRQERVAAIVVNYCTRDLTLQCIDSLIPIQAQFPHFKVYVVDNASPDQSGEELEREISQRPVASWVRVIQAPRNGGFAYGNNIGIREAIAEAGSDELDAVWLLNSDTIVREGALDAIIEGLRESPDVSIFGTRLEWPNGEPQVSCFRFINPLSELITVAATGPVTRLLSRFDVPLHHFDERRCPPPQWVSFASVVIRRRVLETIGLLDEQYFMYFEDVDYCRTAIQAGMRIGFLPKAHVVHLRGGSSPVKLLSAKRKRRPAYYYRSRTRYFAKWQGVTLGPISANLAWYMGGMISMVRQALDPTRMPPCDLEWRDIWTDFLAPLETERCADGRTS